MLNSGILSCMGGGVKVYGFPQAVADFESTGEDTDYFPTVQDGDAYIASFNNFTINEGHIVTTTNRCKGLYLNIQGDLTVNGTLSMTARGAIAPGKYVGINYKYQKILHSDYNIACLCNLLIYPTGGLGIVNGSNQGVKGACGSGGGSIQKYRGGNGTSFSGGSGAGGSIYCSGVTLNGYYGGMVIPEATNSSGWITYNASTVIGSDVGGRGGRDFYASYQTQEAISSKGYYRVWSGVGAGNPRGNFYSSDYDGKNVASSNGTGGLIILIVHGNIVINGTIESNGSPGSNAGYIIGRLVYDLEGGCGSGGGAIHIFHKGEITGESNIKASGGLGGTNVNTVYKKLNGTRASSGGNGTVNIVKF